MGRKNRKNLHATTGVNPRSGESTLSNISSQAASVLNTAKNALGAYRWWIAAAGVCAGVGAVLFATERGQNIRDQISDSAVSSFNTIKDTVTSKLSLHHQESEISSEMTQPRLRRAM